MRGLGGRTYIVTGAASGIGRATAARLLDEGARVVGADLVVPAEPLAGGSGEADRWAFTHVDVTDEASVAELVRAAVAFGGARRRPGQRGRRRGRRARCTCSPPRSGHG